MFGPRPHIRRRAFDRRFEIVAWRAVHEFPRWVCVDVQGTQEKAVQKINELLSA